LFFTIGFLVFLSCIQKRDKKELNEIAITGDLTRADTLCLEKKKLVETVLNLPDVVRYSRLRNVRKAFDTIYIIFNNDDIDCVLTPYIQQGDTLKVINETDSINTIENPVYELIKINIIGNSAYVHLEFDISGAIAFGSLTRLYEEWVPDSTFVTGVR
jgi:hypothetical protein